MEVGCKVREKIIAMLHQEHFSINYDYFLKNAGQLHTQLYNKNNS